jgi:hypothetical protein
MRRNGSKVSARDPKTCLDDLDLGAICPWSATALAARQKGQFLAV